MMDALETKAGLGRDMDELMQAFEAFKDTNDRRLAEIERRGSEDAVTADKLARIEKTMDALALKQARVPLGERDAKPVAELAHKSAFDGYVRKGETANLTALEQKALSVGIDADGGFLVPKETERAVNMALKTVSPIRSIAGVRQVSGSVYKVPFATTGAATGWVGEAAVRPQTNTPTLAELSFPTMELYAMPAATQAILDDSAVDIDAWLAEEVRVAFAQQEGTAFVTGDGVNKPKGLSHLSDGGECLVDVGQSRLRDVGCSGCVSCRQPGRQADRPRLCGEGHLPCERFVRDEPLDARHRAQDEGCRWLLHLAAVGRCGAAVAVARLSRRRSRRHAECCAPFQHSQTRRRARADQAGAEAAGRALVRAS